jgi:hypothetical protein
VARGGRGEPAQNGALAGGVSPPADASDTLNGAGVNGAGATETPSGPNVADVSDAGASDPPGRSARTREQGAFTSLKWTSFFHSCVYASLLICAFALGKPQPETLVLGWTHGALWIGMSLACIAAARMRIVSLRLAVAVAVLGGIGPFFGSGEFVREERRRAR